MAGLALEHIVVDGQNLFIVVGPGDGVGYLEDIDQLVDDNQQSLIPRAGQEGGEQLQKVIPGFVGDDKIDSQLVLCLLPGGVFSPEPFQHIGFHRRVVLAVGFPVGHYRLGEFKAVDHSLQGARHPIDLAFHQRVKLVALRVGRCLDRGLDAGNPFLQYQRKRASVRL